VGRKLWKAAQGVNKKSDGRRDKKRKTKGTKKSNTADIANGRDESAGEARVLKNLNKSATTKGQKIIEGAGDKLAKQRGNGKPLVGDRKRQGGSSKKARSRKGPPRDVGEIETIAVTHGTEGESEGRPEDELI